MTHDAIGYARQLGHLLPKGIAWARTPDSQLGRLLHAFGDGLARIDAAAAGLIREADPRTTTQLLAEWEASAGLPDPCVGNTVATVPQRQSALQARLTATGGAGAPYFEDVAQTLGYTATVDEPAPFVWRLNVVEDTPTTYFVAGAAQAGDPLREWGEAPLECVIERIKPAHTRCLYAYGVNP